MIKKTLGGFLLALLIIGVHYLAVLLSTFAPVLTMVLLATIFTWLIIELYIAIRETL